MGCPWGKKILNRNRETKLKNGKKTRILRRGGVLTMTTPLHRVEALAQCAATAFCQRFETAIGTARQHSLRREKAPH